MSCQPPHQQLQHLHQGVLQRMRSRHPLSSCARSSKQDWPGAGRLEKLRLKLGLHSQRRRRRRHRRYRLCLPPTRTAHWPSSSLSSGAKLNNVNPSSSTPPWTVQGCVSRSLPCKSWATPSTSKARPGSPSDLVRISCPRPARSGLSREHVWCPGDSPLQAPQGAGRRLQLGWLRPDAQRLCDSAAQAKAKPAVVTAPFLGHLSSTW